MTNDLTERLREEIARIVDPIAFDQRDRWTVPNFNVSSTHIAGAAGDCERALAKADQIIAAALNAHPDTSRHVDGAEENARLRQALQELDAVLGGTPMPNCATMNRLIKASANARAALSHPEGQSALVDAARAMADDYQTSPKHHPQHVLVPLAAFEAMRAALAQPDPLTETSGRVDGSASREPALSDDDGDECSLATETPALRLVCEKCGRSTDYDRSIDPGIPGWVVTLSQSHCDADDCDTGDRLIETWLDADGVARDPVASEPKAKSGRRDRSNGQVPGTQNPSPPGDPQ